MAINGNLYTVILHAIIDFLRKKVSDPTGGSGEWITGAYPPLEYTKPQVSVNQIGKPFHRDVSHGDVGEIASYRYNISIFTKGNTHFSVSGKDYSGSSALNYLASLFDKVLKQNKLWWHTKYPEWFIDMEVATKQDLPYKEMLDEYRTDINIIITVIEMW